MPSLITKLGAALLTIVPLTATGCAKKQQQEFPEAKVHLNHISEVIQYKRDGNSGKIFLSPEQDEKKYLAGLSSLSIVHEDIRRVYNWQLRFNAIALQLPQKEIKIGGLPSQEQLDKDKLMFPKENFMVFPFTNPFEINRPRIDEGTQFMFMPYGSYMREKNMPMAFTLSDDFKFIPDSLNLRPYIQRHDDGLLKVQQQGLHFKINENKKDGRTIDIIVPSGSIPLAIATSKEMYLIGLNKVDVGEGIFSVVEEK